MAKLFIVGFPKDMQEIELVEMFSIHGAVNTVTIVTDQLSGANKGYGFITMTDDAGAHRAIHALDGINIDGRTFSVRFAGENLAPVTPRQKRPRRAR
jgi:RNA recognition motif-containing protein